MIPERDIRRFWLWWAKNEALIRKVIEKGSEAKLLELKEHIDRKVLGFGHFTWEIIESQNKTYCLIISPNRDYDRLQLTKKIMKAAPDLAHWEFRYAKPENPRVSPFKMYDALLDPVIIDPSNWEMEFANGIVHIYAENLVEVDPETRLEALDLVVTAHFGEEFRIMEVKQLEWEENYEKKNA
ncbi:hypothetical protein LAG90_16180 [Marinilongibacter aquaticus]|uniref:hypothetical protein n=1 Tax=Marinilongibacter aquaticus TaxID=2975157 RepID=UPI0021BD3F19|nr:hypothetical protein [Marinilongibacter aquaticus]UBM58342.1 hypothetical protein LAG90_16180 [Marinilongibacter aquaticus]